MGRVWRFRVAGVGNGGKWRRREQAFAWPWGGAERVFCVASVGKCGNRRIAGHHFCVAGAGYRADRVKLLDLVACATNRLRVDV